MRRIVSAILILFVFCTLQYGKIATYLYCKWQAEMIQQLKDCGCETHLSSMFAHDETDGVSTVALKEIAAEYTNGLSVAIPLPQSHYGVISHFAEYDFSLPQCYISPALRPPAI